MRGGAIAGIALSSVVALGAAVAAWWGIVIVGDVPTYYLPSPDAVATRLVTNPQLYVRNGIFTLEKILYGGSIGVASGLLLAIVITYVPLLRRIVLPYVITIRVLPKIAIAPVLLIYLGTGTTTAIVFVALIAFFPMVLNAAAGFERVPAAHRDLLASIDAGRVRTFREVTIRYALPDVFAGLKQAVTLSVVGAVVAEWIVASSGLGYLVLIGSENLQTDVMLAALIALLVLGLALYGGLLAVQRLVVGSDLDSIG